MDIYDGKLMMSAMLQKQSWIWTDTREMMMKFDSNGLEFSMLFTIHYVNAEEKRGAGWKHTGPPSGTKSDKCSFIMKQAKVFQNS